MRQYLTINAIKIIHEYLINEFGCSKGLSIMKSLESAIMRPQSGYYNDIYEETAALMESLAMNHLFKMETNELHFLLLM